MIKEQTLDFVKNEAAELGRKFGVYLVSMSVPTNIKEAWLTVLPGLDLAALKISDNDFNQRLARLLRAAVGGKIQGRFDDSATDLVVREMFLRSALEAAAFRLYGIEQSVRKIGADVGDAAKAIKNLCDFYKLDWSAKNSEAEIKQILKKIIRLAFKNIDGQPSKNQSVAEPDYTADAALVRPPKYSWNGPQPGLLEQVDQKHRYVFSAQNNLLDHIINYDSAGRPLARIWYKLDQKSGELKVAEIENWQNNRFESTGKIGQNENDQINALPRYYLDDAGQERPIPTNDSRIFLTPNGTVVRLLSVGSLFRGPKAEYIGRIKGFNPLFPFEVKTPAGTAPIAAHRTDVVIDIKGNVFEFSATGLRAVGELIFDQTEKTTNATFRAGNEYFDFVLEPAAEQPVSLIIKHPTIQKVVSGPLHIIVGTHAFVHSRVPEMTDINGGTAGEEQLRVIEELVVKIALISHALRQEGLTPAYAALLKALHILEDRLWTATARLEQTVGMERNTLIDMAAVRDWLVAAAADPARAVLVLKNTATPRYVA